MKSRIFALNNIEYNSDLSRKLGDGIEALGLYSILKGGQKILLKVNVAGPFPVEQAATTHPEVTRALIRLIREAGSTPVIADAPNSRQPCFSICGLEQLAKEEDVKLFKFDTYNKIHTTGEVFQEIDYSVDVLGADKVISIPKMKTHAFVYYTGAVKNMFGAVNPLQRKKMHLKDNVSVFSNILIDVFLARKPDLAVMDGITAMDGMGPTHGNPKKVGFLACSEDCFALDRLCAELMGYDVKSIPLFIEGKRRKLVSLDNNIMEVIGDSALPDSFDFKLVPVYPEPMRKRLFKIAMGSPIFEHEKCIRCGLCREVCPSSAIFFEEGYPKVEQNKCINCYCCNELCPLGAVYFKKRQFITRG